MTELNEEVTQQPAAPAPTPHKTRKPRSDKGAQRQATKAVTENGLMTVRLQIEPEDSFALHRWLVQQGYEDAAVALTQQSVKHFGTLRLGLERGE